MPETPPLSDTERIVQRFVRGQQQRRHLAPNDAARGPLERHLVDLLTQLSQQIEPTAAAPTSAPPPRRVAIAMALAVHSQPHLTATFGRVPTDGTLDVGERGPYPAEAPFVVPGEVMVDALGLSEWELDDLREDVDRRAGHALKQRRALAWIWSHFGMPGSRPGPLFRVLFPGQDLRANACDLVLRGGRLYAVLDVPPHPLPSLYLGWMGAEQVGALPPLASFRARYVDHGLRRAIARGIGADPPEVDRILDRMVALVPRERVVDYLERDQWRVTGLSSLSGLADDYLGEMGLLDPVERKELEWERWLAVKNDEVTVGRPAKALFDEFALTRAQAVLKQVYAAMLARIEQTDEGDEGLKPEDLELFDLGNHFRVALEPLVRWARSDKAHAHVAARLRVDVEDVERALLPLAEEWEQHLEERWLAPPTAERRHTIVALCLTHLAALRNSLSRMALREPDVRWEHRSLGLLFAAHYLVDAPIERIWLKGLSDMLTDQEAPLPPPEDIVGCWFWPTWQRLLYCQELETQPTMTPE